MDAARPLVITEGLLLLLLLPGSLVPLLRGFAKSVNLHYCPRLNYIGLNHIVSRLGFVALPKTKYNYTINKYKQIKKHWHVPVVNLFSR